MEHNLAEQIAPDWDQASSPKRLPPAKAEPKAAPKQSALDPKPSPPVQKNDDDEKETHDEHVLAFPSISTATFQFDVEKAVSVLVDEVCVLRCYCKLFLNAFLFVKGGGVFEACSRMCQAGAVRYERFYRTETREKNVVGQKGWEEYFSFLSH